MFSEIDTKNLGTVVTCVILKSVDSSSPPHPQIIPYYSASALSVFMLVYHFVHHFFHRHQFFNFLNFARSFFATFSLWKTRPHVICRWFYHPKPSRSPLWWYFIFQSIFYHRTGVYYLIPIIIRAPLIFAYLACAKIKGSMFAQYESEKIKGEETYHEWMKKWQIYSNRRMCKN